MFYLIQFHWVWTLLALLLGAAIGWSTWAKASDDQFGSWISWAAVPFVIGLIVALLRLLPGRMGYWLDMALLMFATYIIGCCIGCWLKRRLDPDPVIISNSAAIARSSLMDDARKSADASLSAPAASGAAPSPDRKPPTLAAPTSSSQNPATVAVVPSAIKSDPVVVPSISAAQPQNQASATAQSATRQIGQKPAGLALPERDNENDLKLIKGIGPANEKTLNDLGIFHFRQIANWTPPEAVWTGHHIAFPGRIEREHWIDQATILADGGETDHSRAFRAGHIPADDTPLNDAEVAILKASLTSAQPSGPSASVTADAKSNPAEPVTPEGQSSPAGQAGPARQTSPAGQPETAQTSHTHPGSKPAGIAAPSGGTKDDLKEIKGIGPKNERVLNDLGIFHFCQIADWTPSEAEWTSHHVAFPGRIEREHWIDQADILCKGGETEHSRAVKGGQIRPDDAPLGDADVADLKAKLVALTADPHMPPALAQPPGVVHPGSKPIGLAAPTGGAKDDLKLIKGIGAKNEIALNDLGIFHFCQIADWTGEEAVWTGHHMAFPGRIEREHWIDQAKLLCAGIDTEHAKSVRTGAVMPDDAPLSAEEASRLKSDLPEQIGSVVSEDKHEGRRPLGLSQPRGGSSDDLKRIKGIGPQNESRLHGLGIWHFDQIAAWSNDNIRWIGSYLAFPGRIDRERWVAQARILATGGATDFSKRVDKGAMPKSRDDRRHDAATPAPGEPKERKH
jgi:predicted flap endonuclease-1-like 5' DNA nuclease